VAKQPTAQQLADRFDRRARRLQSLGDEATRLRNRGQITLGSCDSIYESALLNLVTAFELVLEDLFYSMLLGASAIPGTSGAVQFKDRGQAEDVLLAGRAYLDWLPFDRHVAPLGERLLTGSPFSRLDRHPQEKRALDEISVVRNAIAHESGSARKKFAPLANGLRPRRRTPAGLLQDVRQGVSVNVHYSTQLRLLVRALTVPTTKAAKALLSPESPHAQGATPGKGTYACMACGTRTTLTAAKQALPPCVVCRAAAGGKAKGGHWRRRY
jgi:hypothetical protein